MPEQSLEKNIKPARSLGIALGVTEILFLAGLGLLATGVSLAYSPAHALIVCGVLLVIAAFYNAGQG